MKRLAPYLDLILEERSGEEWRDIIEYDGRYLVSNMGRVKSYPRIRTYMGTEYLTKSIIRKQYLNKYKDREGQPKEATLKLYDGFKHKTYSVAGLVADAFLRPREADECILHNNRNPYDNRLTNLRIGSYEELYKVNLETGVLKLSGRNHPKIVLNQRGTWDGDKLVSVICIKCNEAKPPEHFRLSQNQYTCQKCKNDRAQELKKIRANSNKPLNQFVP